MMNLKADTSPIVGAIQEIPSSDEMILEAKDSYLNNMMESEKLLKNVVSTCQNQQRKD